MADFFVPFPISRACYRTGVVKIMFFIFRVQTSLR